MTCLWTSPTASTTPVPLPTSQVTTKPPAFVMFSTCMPPLPSVLSDAACMPSLHVPPFSTPAPHTDKCIVSISYLACLHAAWCIRITMPCTLTDRICCFLQRTAIQQRVGSITLSQEPGVLAQPCVVTVALRRAMSPACTKDRTSAQPQRNTHRTALPLGSLSASSSALQLLVNHTCGSWDHGATAPGVSRIGQLRASVSRVDLQMAQ